MLDSIDLPQKDYEEFFAEALAQIPFYSEEWTNFNRSDPGITILQNLSAFHALQQQEMNQMSALLQEKLLAILGVTPQENQAATLLLQAPQGETLSLPPLYRLTAGSLCFETSEPVHIKGWGLQDIYSVQGEKVQQITRLLTGDAKTVAYPFGRTPMPENALYCVLTEAPSMGEPLRLWAEIPADDHRNPFSAEMAGFCPCETKWQYYTAQGWVDLDTIDETHGLLANGSITLTMGEIPPAVFPLLPVYGYTLRCLLVRRDADIVPVLRRLSCNLFAVKQQCTRAKAWISTREQAVLSGDFALSSHWFVYGKESAAGDYVAYREAQYDESGRYYRLVAGDDQLTLVFDEATFGFAPYDGADAVMICCYDDEMIYHREIGTVAGYEQQVLPLDLVRRLLPDGCSLLAEFPGEAGEPPTYRRVLPGDTDPEQLCYRFRTETGEVEILHPGYDQRYRLYLCDCTTTNGAEGNIYAGMQLAHLGGYDGTTVERSFFAPSPGRGGQSHETIEGLRRRMLQNLHRMQALVTEEDYESFIRNLPGLAIHKVKAVANPQKNQVTVAVKPYAEIECPKLSESCRQYIQSALSQARLVAVRTEVQSVRYIRFDVQAKLSIYPHAEGVEAAAAALIRNFLDMTNDDRPMGSWVRYADLHFALASLSGVYAVEQLQWQPETAADVSQSSLDYRLGELSLCYPGEIKVTLQVSKTNLR